MVAVYVILRLLVVLIIVNQARNGNYENVFYGLIALILFTLPSYFEHRFIIDIPDTLEAIILIFIFAAEILGEIGAYYQKVPFWDTMLHTVTGFLTGAIGFSLVSLLNRETDSFNLSPFYLAFVSLCFSMFIGVMWEFIEFLFDWFLSTDMQKDTIVNTIRTVTLDPTRSNKVVVIKGITNTAVNGTDLGINGYLDIGLIDTMKDLFVMRQRLFPGCGYASARKRLREFWEDRPESLRQAALLWSATRFCNDTIDNPVFELERGIRRGEE